MHAVETPILRFIALCLVAATLPGHGGQYRGPAPALAGPVISPNPFGPPGGPGPLAPTARPETTSGRGVDLSRWQLWWEYNKEQYLRRLPGDGDDAGTALSEELKAEIILPPLVEALESTRNRDITTACLVAIAKIGVDHRSKPILPMLAERLRRGDQEIRETAALALGITERADALAPLRALVLDQPEGRRLLGKAKVDDRTRAFAAFGLGLVAQGQDDADVKAVVLETLQTVLEAKQEKSRDVQVAALNGLRLLRPETVPGSRGKRLMWQALEAITRFERRQLGKARQEVQAHAATAIARLLGRGTDADHERYKKAFAERVLGRSEDHQSMPRSAALALGRLVEPDDAGCDGVCVAALQRAVTQASDHQVRSFAMIALAQIGGDAAEETLTRTFRRAKGPTQAWAALACGVLAHHADKTRRDNRNETAADRVGRLLHRHLSRAGNPDVRSAIAVGLGLAGYTPASKDLRKLLKRYRKYQELGGYLCIGLALMDDVKATPLLEAILDDSRHRPLLMAQAARALARLQQRDAAATLHRMLHRKDHSALALSGAAIALGMVGDAGSVAPLLKILRDKSEPKLVRAFAAAALGALADNDRLPWNAHLAQDINYRAVTETLSNGATGVLDLL
ncbi:MAG: HEAT repeat domain-containing protein [Planctomycetota bacterium]